MPHHIHVAASGSHAGALLLLPRFSWQCGRFHELSKFQDGNKSCRDALARHNARRQRRKEGLRASRVGTAHAAGALYRVHSSAELNSPMARPMQPRNQQHAAGAAGSAAGVRRVLSCPGLAEAAMPQLQGGGAGQATASSAQPLSMPSPAQLQGCGAEAAAAMATPFASMAALPFEAGAAPVASGMGMNAVAYRGCTHRRASSLPALLQPPQPLHAGGWGYQADAANTFNPAPLHAPAEGLYAGPSPYPSPGLARQGELQQAMLQPQSLLAGSSLGTATAPAAGPWQPAAWERLGTPASSMPASPLAPASPASGNGAAGVEGRPPHAAGSARCRKLAKFEVCGSPGHRATSHNAAGSCMRAPVVVLYGHLLALLLCVSASRQALRPPHHVAAHLLSLLRLAASALQTDLERVSFKLFQAPSTQLAPHVLQGVIKLMLEDPVSGNISCNRVDLFTSLCSI